MKEIDVGRESKRSCWGALAAAAVTALAGCGPELPAPEADTEIGEDTAAIFNGDLVGRAINPGAVAVYHNYARPCSGSLIRRNQVLTARHCLTNDDINFLPVSQISASHLVDPGPTPPSSAIGAASDVFSSEADDIAVIRLASDMPGTRLGLGDGTPFAMPGTVRARSATGCFTTGPADSTIEDGTDGAGTLRAADTRDPHRPDSPSRSATAPPARASGTATRAAVGDQTSTSSGDPCSASPGSTSPRTPCTRAGSTRRCTAIAPGSRRPCSGPAITTATGPPTSC